jgi:hypothetical protein
VLQSVWAGQLKQEPAPLASACQLVPLQLLLLLLLHFERRCLHWQQQAVDSQQHAAVGQVLLLHRHSFQQGAALTQQLDAAVDAGGSQSGTPVPAKVAGCLADKIITWDGPYLLQ